MTITNNPTSHQLDHFQIARSFSERLRGLTIYQKHPDQLSFVLLNCKLVHTFGMSYNLDLIFIDRNYRIIELYEDVAPCKIQGAYYASHTIELDAGSIRKLKISKGDLICSELLTSE